MCLSTLGRTLLEGEPIRAVLTKLPIASFQLEDTCFFALRGMFIKGRSA